MTTIVYPYLHRLSQGDELKYSIRSLCKYAKFDFDIVLVGDKPDWYNGKFIPTTPIRNKRFTRAFDIAKKLEIICESKIISENFIYMYDDQYFINDVYLSDLEKSISINEIKERRKPNVGSEVWRELMSRTVDALVSNGNDIVYNYETHLPRTLNKKKLKLIIDAYDLHHVPLLFNTLYFNEYFEQPEIILEKENKIKAGIYKAMTSDEIRNLCASKLIMNHGEKAFNHPLKLFLKNTYHKICKFELNYNKDDK
jgi:hypothetical protein